MPTQRAIRRFGNLRHHETLGLVIPPQYLDADNAGTGSLAEMLNAPALVEAARAQQP